MDFKKVKGYSKYEISSTGLIRNASTKSLLPSEAGGYRVYNDNNERELLQKEALADLFKNAPVAKATAIEAPTLPPVETKAEPKAKEPKPEKIKPKMEETEKVVAEPKAEATPKAPKVTTPKPEKGSAHTEEQHTGGKKEEILSLYNKIKKDVLALGSDVTVKPKQQYVGFIRKTNFVDIAIQKSSLKTWINLRKGELKDPKGIMRDVSGIGHHGNGDYAIIIDSETDLPYVMGLIKQSYDKQA